MGLQHLCCATAVVLISCGGQALAQPRPAPAPPAKPADGVFEAAKAAFEALPEAERKAIQDALVGTGDYNAGVGGEFGRRTFEAVNAYARRAKLPANGILDAQARKTLLAAAQRAREAAKFTLSSDPRTGVLLGVPERILVKRDVNPNGGTRWQNADGKITLDTRATLPGEGDLASLYERNLSIQTPGRQVTYKLLRPDFFVIAGETPTGKFYMRYAASPTGLRGFSIGYDKALANTFDKMVLAIANSFVPFQAPPAIAGARGEPDTKAKAEQTPTSKLVASGIVIGRDLIVTSAAVESCSRPAVAGASASITQVDKSTGLALLQARIDPRLDFAFRARDSAEVRRVIVLSYAPVAGKAEGDLVVTPAEISATGLTAPLQQGASGGAVVDRAGALVGLVGVLRASPVLIAGVVPTLLHPFVGVQDVVKIASQPSSPGPTGPPDGPYRTAGEIATEWRSRIVSITCG